MTTRADPRFRLRVHSYPHPDLGWAWWYEVLDMAEPEESRVKITGLRPDWRSTLAVGEQARRYLEGYRSNGWD